MKKKNQWKKKPIEKKTMKNKTYGKTNQWKRKTN